MPCGRAERIASSAVTASPPIGVLLAQLGTPAAPTTPAVRAYLKQFLSDRRVVDVNPWLWKPLLHGVILRTRPRRSAAAYRRIWTPEGSPLLVHSRAQETGIAERLGPGFRVELGMRLGEPRLHDALDRLVAAGCEHVVVLPLFPQHSGATTGSVFDGIAEWARGRRGLPKLTFVRGFAEHPAWIAAWVERVRESGARPTVERPLLVSFHGIPVRHVAEGDPYARECEATVAALRLALQRELGIAPEALRVAFQSRFGRERWLEPYLEPTLVDLARAGTTGVSVLPASFVADCLETLDELGHELRAKYLASGGRDYTLVACPNASPAALDALAAIVREHA
jgi:ferrochelatase